MVLETCRELKSKINTLKKWCVKLVTYQKYCKMHGQHNVKYRRAFVDSAGNIILDRLSGSVIAI
jgi:hypothetical protein